MYFSLISISAEKNRLLSGIILKTVPNFYRTLLAIYPHGWKTDCCTSRTKFMASSVVNSQSCHSRWYVYCNIYGLHWYLFYPYTYQSHCSLIWKKKFQIFYINKFITYTPSVIPKTHYYCISNSTTLYVKIKGTLESIFSYLSFRLHVSQHPVIIRR